MSSRVQFYLGIIPAMKLKGLFGFQKLLPAVFVIDAVFPSKPKPKLERRGVFLSAAPTLMRKLKRGSRRALNHEAKSHVPVRHELSNRRANSV